MVCSCPKEVAYGSTFPLSALGPRGWALRHRQTHWKCIIRATFTRAVTGQCRRAISVVRIRLTPRRCVEGGRCRCASEARCPHRTRNRRRRCSSWPLAEGLSVQQDSCSKGHTCQAPFAQTVSPVARGGRRQVILLAFEYERTCRGCPEKVLDVLLWQLLRDCFASSLGRTICSTPTATHAEDNVPEFPRFR